MPVSRKARSRLVQNKPVSPPQKSAKPFLIRLGQRYLKFLPTGLLSVPFWIVVWLILTKVSPSYIQNMWISGSFGPLILTLWFALFFSSTFLFLRTRRGLAAASFVSLVVLLQLRAVSLGWTNVGWLLGLIGLPLLSTELLEIGLRRHASNVSTTKNKRRIAPKYH